MAKRRGLTVRVSDDFVVNFNKAAWFIDLENWFWAKNQRRYRNVTYKEWAKEMVKPFRPYFSIRFYKVKKLGKEQSVSGYYEAHHDTTRDKPITIQIAYEEWPDITDTFRRRALMFEFIKVVAHELNHQRQYRVRKNFNPYYVEPYYHDPDEIQSWALNAAQSVIARHGIRKSKKIFWDFDLVKEKRYCSEHHAYATMPEKVKKRFLRHVAKYIGIYDDYYKGTQNIGVPRQLLKKSQV